MNFILTPGHQQFLGDLHISSIAVFAVAIDQHLLRRKIEIPPIRKAPTVAEAWLYSDQGDLFVTTIHRVRHRLDVKRQRHCFINTWPHPRVFVDTVQVIERAGNSVSAYINVSHDLAHMAIIRRETRDHWFPFEYPFEDRVKHVYACPPQYVEFRPVRRLA